MCCIFPVPPVLRVSTHQEGATVWSLPLLCTSSPTNQTLWSDSAERTQRAGRPVPLDRSGWIAHARLSGVPAMGGPTGCASRSISGRDAAVAREVWTLTSRKSLAAIFALLPASQLRKCFLGRTVKCPGVFLRQAAIKISNLNLMWE